MPCCRYHEGQTPGAGVPAWEALAVDRRAPFVSGFIGIQVEHFVVATKERGDQFKRMLSTSPRLEAVQSSPPPRQALSNHVRSVWSFTSRVGRWRSAFDAGSPGLFGRHQEAYTWTNPTCCVHNVIIGKLWIEQYGMVEILNHR